MTGAYHVLYREGNEGTRAAFSSDIAREIHERWNDRYESDYRLEEVDEVTASELKRGDVIRDAEDLG